MTKKTEDQISTIIIIIAILSALKLIQYNLHNATQITQNRNFCINKIKLDNVYWNKDIQQCEWGKDK